MGEKNDWLLGREAESKKRKGDLISLLRCYGLSRRGKASLFNFFVCFDQIVILSRLACCSAR